MDRHHLIALINQIIVNKKIKTFYQSSVVVEELYSSYKVNEPRVVVSLLVKECLS